MDRLVSLCHGQKQKKSRQDHLEELLTHMEEHVHEAFLQPQPTTDGMDGLNMGNADVQG